MRILLVANKMPYPPKDGGSIATFSLGKAFHDLGHHLEVVALNTSKHFTNPDDIPPAIEETFHFHPVYVDTTIRPLALFRNFIFSSFPYNAERFVTADMHRMLEEVLVNGDFDVIQLEGLYVAPYLDTIRKHCKALVTMRAHNVEHEIWERTIARQEGLKKLYVKSLTNRVLKMDLKYLNQYDALVPITHRDGIRFEQMGCRLPIHVTPTGIDTEAFPPDRTGEEFPSIFHIGALDWMPNQEGIMWFLENVWPSLHERFPALKFYIAGRNAPPSISSIRQEGVVFVGEVDDAYAFMRKHSIMVVPLLSGSGMRIKIIEGMALGKAIVSTSIGAEGIAAASGDHIVIENAPEGFIQKVSRLVENKEDCWSMGAQARTFIKENFDNLAIAASLLKFYEEQLNDH